MEKPGPAESSITALGEAEEERSLEVKGKGLFLVAAMLLLPILAASCKKSHSKRKPPRIDSIERVTVRSYPPDWGLEGDVVRIDGGNFSVSVSANTVTFEGLGATVLLAKGNQLTVFVPVGTNAGVVPVKVAVGTLESNEVDFTILQLPTITALVPDFGPKGALVTIQGRYFGILPDDNIITFPDQADPLNMRVQSPTLSATPNELTCFVPPEAATGDVTVEVTPDVSDPVRFTVTTPRLDLVKDRTAAAIDSLPTTNFFFNVIAFDCQARAWSPNLMQATSQNKSDAINLFVNTLLPSGSSNTGLGGAAGLATDSFNRTVTLVSDGLPTCGPTSAAAHLCEILTANTQGAQIHTFAVQGFGEFVTFMQDMATLTGGTYNAAN